MSPEERKTFYFPAWRRCAHARGWVMADGRLQADLAAQRQGASPTERELVQVLDLAESFARQGHRSVTAENLRHACNHVASAGKTVHSAQMSHRATNQAVRLFNLLADPDDLNAVWEWLNPDEADRRSYVRWMKRLAPEARLIAIAKNTWGTVDWESQSMDRLRWLARTVREQGERRRRSFAAAVSGPDPF